MKRHVEPQDVWAVVLERVAKRPMHEPREMRSANSRGPIRSFLCDECAPYVGLVYVFCASDTTPICYGSSMTMFPHDESLRRAF